MSKWGPHSKNRDKLVTTALELVSSFETIRKWHRKGPKSKVSRKRESVRECQRLWIFV